MTCTRHEHLGAFTSISSRGDGALPFALPGAPRRFSRDREVDLRHVVLDLKVDFETRSLSGTATHFLTPLRPGVSRITLDAVEMDVEWATVGGKLDQLYFAFGEHDVIAIATLPDNVSAGALAVAVASSGAAKAMTTTVLMTAEEGQEVMRKAASVAYVAPGTR